MKKIAVIGSGFAGLSAALCLAKEGHSITVFEKNSSPGGRARKFESNGYVFDMGPSWYWMPEVFDKFFNQFGKKASDLYTLTRLNPSYRIYFSAADCWDIPAGEENLYKLFEDVEPGSSAYLKKFLDEAKFKYEIGINELVYKPGLSVSELFDWRLISGALKLHVFQSLAGYIRKSFKDPRIIQLLEFPVLFLGSTAQKTPALYSLMNYADMALGTWYPQGGMYKVIEAMVAIGKDLNVQFNFNAEISELIVESDQITGVRVGDKIYRYDYVIAGADYHHVEQKLLPEQSRRYSHAYWESRSLAPSSLIFYLGFRKKIKGLNHHTLFFDQDFSLHGYEIYHEPQWPTSPLFYVSCPSKTDPSVAPLNHENVFILIPVAPGLTDNPATRERYFNMVINRLEKITGEPLQDFIDFKKSYAHNDFIRDYHSFKGNAYGLANTLRQTANLKPSIINKKVKNLFYTGQLTVPGPGVPPSLISGQVVAQQVLKSIAGKIVN